MRAADGSALPPARRVDPRDAFAALQAAAADGRLDALCERRRLALLGVFGSVVDPEPLGEPGDLDVCVSVRRGVTLDTLALLDDLVVLTGCEQIDLARIDGDDVWTIALRANALAGVGLYEHTAGAWAETQMRAFVEREDTEWLRRLALEALAG